MTTARNPRCAVLRGDCSEILKRFPERSIDLVVTDPPYLARYRSRDGRRIINDDNDTWMKPAFTQIARVLKPDRFCVSFYGWPHADKFLSVWRACGLHPIEHLVWHKSYPSSTGFARRRHECAYLLAKGNPKRPVRLLDDVMPWKYTGNRLHPSQKPEQALASLIASFSAPGDVVLDPFMGSGTTGKAARHMGRHFVGIEIDPRYFAIAQERLEAGRAVPA